MIQYNPKNWFTLIFRSHGRYVTRYLLPIVLGMGILSFGIVFVFNEIYPIQWVLKTGVHSLLGIVLGLVLVFRTNSAYDRWWEGRKLWGALVNHSRSLAMKMNAALKHEDRDDRKFFARIIGDFANGLKNHLRGIVRLDDLDREIYPETAFEGSPHIPNRILSLAFQRIALLHGKGKIDGDQFRVINRDLEGFADVLGACERIKNTPIPISYSVYIKKFIFIYLVTLPLGFKEEFNYWTVPAVMFITYVLLGIEMIGEEVEDPFGLDENDLPTDGIAANISANVHEILHVARPEKGYAAGKPVVESKPLSDISV